MLLYSHPLSGNTHKVRLLLGFLGLAYEECKIDIPSTEGGVPTADYPAVSPWLDRVRHRRGFTPMPGFA